MNSNGLYNMCREEYKAHAIYSLLSRNPLIPRETRSILEKASKDEYKHYVLLKSIIGECARGFSRFKVYFYAILLWLYGPTVVLKLLESGESKALSDYTALKNVNPALIEEIIEDEEEHERAFLEGIDEKRIRYLGSIALGITDALIELTGIYTGSLGILVNTAYVGLVGTIAGLSASISMGIASYTQAKQTGLLKPITAALYTMVSYMVVALLLALPYFMIASVVYAFSVMTAIAIAVIAYMSFYTSVLQGKKYVRELLENTALVLGVALLLYTVGSSIRSVLGSFVD